jgi:hypothetical protein
MTPEQFAYWLQGYVEIRGSTPTPGEWDVIKDHLATVFKKVTPDRQPYPLGPAIAEPYRGTPAIPTPLGPYIDPKPYTMPPNYPRPEVICSTVNAAGGMGFSSINIKDLT